MLQDAVPPRLDHRGVDDTSRFIAASRAEFERFIGQSEHLRLEDPLACHQSPHGASPAVCLAKDPLVADIWAGPGPEDLFSYWILNSIISALPKSQIK